MITRVANLGHRSKREEQGITPTQFSTREEGDQLHVCIIQPKLNAVSETFLQAQADFLPARVTVVHGDPPQVEGRMFSDSLFTKGLRKIRRTIARSAWESPYPALLQRAVGALRPDVVLAQYGPTGVRALPACRALGVPLVVHFHGYDASMLGILDEYREAYQELFREASGVVAVSRAMERQLVSLGAPAEKVFYCPYGVDCSRFNESNPQNAAPVFLAVGRFVEKKAPYLTLLAFSQVVKECPDARLRMIGGGNMLGPCQDLARALHLADRVTFLGEQGQDVVQAEMKAARCFVQHSVTASSGDSEGTPVAIIEACASGLPVIATRHAGIPDVVVENETGLLVDERDVDGMAAQMIQLAKDPALAALLGKNARARVMRNFSLEQSIERLWKVLAASIHKRQEI